MKSRSVSVFAVAAIWVTASSWAAIRTQQPAVAAKDSNAEADDKIIAEVRDHNQIMSNLEYVSDMIGQRLTGSENLKKANERTRQKFADYGVANPHLESWTIAHTWERGAASGRIISPSLHPLAIASYAWAPSTNGAVRGPVVYVKAQSLDDLAQYKGKLKGAIVISAEPALLPPPDQPAPNPVNIPYGDSIVLVAPHRPGAQSTPAPGYREFIRARTEFFKNEGVLATLADSGKPDGLLWDDLAPAAARSSAVGARPEKFHRRQARRSLQYRRGNSRQRKARRNRPARRASGFLGSRHRDHGQRHGLNDCPGSCAGAAEIRPAAQTHHPLRFVFRRRARLERLARVRHGAQRRIAQIFRCADSRRRHRSRHQHQPDAQLPGP